MSSVSSRRNVLGEGMRYRADALVTRLVCVDEDTCVCGGGYERTCAIARMGWLLLLRAFAGLLTEG